MRWWHLAFALVSIIVGNAAISKSADEAVVTLQSLLHEMTNVDSVARWPEPAYSCRQASSYDRASKTPADAKNWFANADQNQFIRTEMNAGRKEKVMLDADGPGAIVRFWLTCGDNKQGCIRIYFDGAKKPAISIPAFDFISNSALQAGYPLLTAHPCYATKGPGGNTLYLPIPYAKHCKVTWEEGDATHNASRYYQINYRTYPPSTKVETFPFGELNFQQAAKVELESANRDLSNPPTVSRVQSLNNDATIAPSGEFLVPLPSSPAAIRELEVEPDTSDPQTLRSLVLGAKFDGENTVWCPLSDFFGSGVGINTLKSWYRAVTPQGKMVCRWAMPYQKSARLVFHNYGESPVHLKVVVSLGDWQWDNRSMHFHANWRQQFPLATRPYSDWNFITTGGQGVYVGDTLCVLNPVTQWWGEGDEKIWVDGESFPSHFGTGTEDYYCYSWCDTRCFQTPFANQVRCDGPGNKGQTVVTRTRNLDAIPFTKSLKFDMEIWHWADCKMAYAATTYWYALPGAKSNRGGSLDEVTRPLPALPPPFHIAGALECEKLQILSKSPGVVTEIQTGAPQYGEWSNAAQLLVHGNKAGDFLELEIPAADQEPKKLILHATKSWDYGILRFFINGHAAGKDFDAYSDQVVLSGPIKLGQFEPKDGKYILRVEVVGANPSSKNTHSYFGLDAITIKNP